MSCPMGCPLGCPMIVLWVVLWTSYARLQLVHAKSVFFSLRRCAPPPPCRRDWNPQRQFRKAASWWKQNAYDGKTFSIFLVSKGRKYAAKRIASLLRTAMNLSEPFLGSVVACVTRRVFACKSARGNHVEQFSLRVVCVATTLQTRMSRKSFVCASVSLNPTRGCHAVAIANATRHRLKARQRIHRSATPSWRVPWVELLLQARIACLCVSRACGLNCNTQFASLRNRCCCSMRYASAT